MCASNAHTPSRRSTGVNHVCLCSSNCFQAVFVHFGKLFFSDPVWQKYDVIIDPNMLTGGNYPRNGENFEHVVRTAKVFVADHYEDSGLIEEGAIEGTTVSITSLPWHEAKAFRVADIIQRHPPIWAKMRLPSFEKIAMSLGGRTRCAGEFFGRMDASSAMVVDEAGQPVPEAAWRYTYPVGCPAPPEIATSFFIGPYGPAIREKQFLPTAWAESPYVAPYELEKLGLSAMPPEAVFDIERYSEEEICRLKPSYCEYNKSRGFPITKAGGCMNASR